MKPNSIHAVFFLNMFIRKSHMQPTLKQQKYYKHGQILN